MEQELLISKIILNINEFGVSLRDSLNYAYAGGFDAKNKVNGSEIPVEYTDKEGRTQVFPSVSCASRRLKIHRSTIFEACKLNRKTKNGCYFRYADAKPL